MKRMHCLAAALLGTAAIPAGVEARLATTPAAADAALSFEVYLPLRDVAALDALLAAQQTEGSPSYHKWLTPAQFGRRFGPTADQVAAAKAALQQAGLSVTRVSTRSLTVSGTVASASALLGTSLGVTAMADDHGRTIATGPVKLPAALQAVGAEVIDFAPVPPHHALVRERDLKPVPLNRNGPDGGYWFTDLKQAYDYPSYQATANGKRLDGTGASVAILMADLITQNDINSYFNHENFTQNGGTAIPTVAIAKVNGGGTVGGGGAVEASLDAEMVTGGAPGANVTLVSLPDLSDKNIAAGYNYIVNQNTYDIVTSSFGACELFYTAAYAQYFGENVKVLQKEDEIFKQGNAQGITFLASSGDNGGLECVDTKYLDGGNGSFVKGVSTPAASAYVTAVGGTNLVTASTSGSLDSAYVSENGYGDPLITYDPYNTGGKAKGGYWGAGGGISTIYKAPASQKGTDTGSKKFRTVPDIGMHVGGCPGGIAQTPCGPDRSFVYIYYHGKAEGVIGTSVSSPEFAGAMALYVGQNGRLGDANAYLYKMGMRQTKSGGINAPAASAFFHRDIPGNDGVYTDTQPSVNYNYIVGNGTPFVRRLFGFTSADPAGIPQTASNP